jgi:hypothetical protein
MQGSASQPQQTVPEELQQKLDELVRWLVSQQRVYAAKLERYRERVEQTLNRAKGKGQCALVPPARPLAQTLSR